MSDTLVLHGSLTSGQGACGCSGMSFSPAIAACIEESLALKGSPITGEFELTDDAPVSVPLASLSRAHAVFVKAVGGKVRVRLTSADGSSQAIPVDSVLFVISESVHFTAIDLTRAAGVSVTVRVLLAEAAL